ncbi:MAG: hypothetical protein MUD01_09865 [Chloroflexaceae bacterium]|jgi:hypothetical protein|nr:hypothetical protein [Chloroflexaceae bacterium]
MILTVAPGDLWALRRKPRSQVLLYNDLLLAQPHRPLWFSLRCLLQGSGRDCAMTVYRDRGRSAMVQSHGRSGRAEQDVIYMAAYGNRGPGTPSDSDIWFRLLDRLCVNAGNHSVQRLFASIPDHHDDVREIFRQLGFQVYTHRTLLQLSGPDWDQGTTLAPMRFQSRRDHWAIHKLYGAVTPHQVQYAESRNARSWALPMAQRWVRHRRRAWVLGPDDNLSAYLHIVSGTAAHVMTVLMHPDARAGVTDVLRFGLAQLHDNRPVCLALREYQEELLAPAQDLGFQPLWEQSLLVKSMVVTVRRPMLIPALEPSMEPRITAPNISTPREDS